MGLLRGSSESAAAAAKSLQSCPTLCDPIDDSPPGSAIPGILQARTLEWVAISFSNAWKWKVKVRSLSRVRLFATPWTVAYQAFPSMGFSRQEYWSGMPSPSPPTPVRRFYFPCNLAKIKHSHILKSLPVWWVENIILICISSLLKLGTFSRIYWTSAVKHLSISFGHFLLKVTAYFL